MGEKHSWIKLQYIVCVWILLILLKTENWKQLKKKKLITVHPQNYLHGSYPINSIRDVELKKKEKKKKMADANASHTNAIQT